MLVPAPVANDEATPATDELAERRKRPAHASTRWDRDGFDLKQAITSTHEAAMHLLQAHSYHEIDPSRSDALLRYSLDQAFLARGLLDEYLFRHGRDVVRPEVDESEEQPVDARRQKRADRKTKRSKKQAKYKRERYQQRVDAQQCVSCPEPPQPAEPGHVECKSCRASRQQDAAERQKSVAETMRGKMDGR